MLVSLVNTDGDVHYFVVMVVVAVVVFLFVVLCVLWRLVWLFLMFCICFLCVCRCSALLRGAASSGLAASPAKKDKAEEIPTPKKNVDLCGT